MPQDPIQSTPLVTPEELFGATPQEHFSNLAKSTALKYNLDPDIFSKQMSHESIHFNSNVISGKKKSPKGATGIAQFMPATARRYGLSPSDLNDPVKSLDAGARHMRDLLDSNDNDYERALAAYNAGQGRVDDNSWRKITETRNYVKNIMGFVSDELKPIVNDTELFGTSTSEDKPTVNDEEFFGVKSPQAVIKDISKNPSWSTKASEYTNPAFENQDTFAAFLSGQSSKKIEKKPLRSMYKKGKAPYEPQLGSPAALGNTGGGIGGKGVNKGYSSLDNVRSMTDKQKWEEIDNNIKAYNRAVSNKRLAQEGIEEDKRHGVIANIARHQLTNLLTAGGHTAAQIIGLVSPETRNRLLDTEQDIQAVSGSASIPGREGSLLSNVIYGGGILAPKLIMPGGVLGFAIAVTVSAYGEGKSIDEAIKSGIEAAATAGLAGSLSRKVLENGVKGFFKRAVGNTIAPAIVRQVANPGSTLITPEDAAFGIIFSLMHPSGKALAKNIDISKIPESKIESIKAEIDNPNNSPEVKLSLQKIIDIVENKPQEVKEAQIDRRKSIKEPIIEQRGYRLKGESAEDFYDRMKEFTPIDRMPSREEYLKSHKEAITMAEGPEPSNEIKNIDYTEDKPIEIPKEISHEQGIPTLDTAKMAENLTNNPIEKIKSELGYPKSFIEETPADISNIINNNNIRYGGAGDTVEGIAMRARASKGEFEPSFGKRNFKWDSKKSTRDNLYEALRYKYGIESKDIENGKVVAKPEQTINIGDIVTINNSNKSFEVVDNGTPLKLKDLETGNVQSVGRTQVNTSRDEGFGFFKPLPEDAPQEFKDAYDRLKNKGAKLNSGIDPKDIIDYGMVAGYKLYAKGKDFASWSKEVIEKVGEQVKPYLKDMWNLVHSTSKNNDTFYSPLERLINSDKVSNKVNTKQLGGLLKGEGISKDELELTGLGDFIKDKDSINKQELLDEIKKNKINVEEVKLGEGRKDYEWEQYGDTIRSDDGNINIERITSSWYSVNTRSGTRQGASSLEEAKDIANGIRKNAGYGVDNTQFSTYQEPGAKEGSYREMFLTLPNGNKLTVPKGATEINTGNLSKDISQAVDMYNDRFSELYDKYGDGVRLKATPEELAEIDYYNSIVGGKAKGWNDGHGQYSNIKNPIVRLRFNEREGNVKEDGTRERVMFLEELQSPSKSNQEKMPPWAIKNWRELGIKKALQYAAENGFDRVAWTNGEMQADRYDLSKQVDYVEWNGINHLEVYDKAGNKLTTVEDASEAKLEEYIGKDAAKKLIEAKADNQGWRTLEGIDLKVGGEGLKKLYDKDIPSVVGKIGKKYGSVVESIDIKSSNKYRYTKDNIADVYRIYDRNANELDTVKTEQEAKDWIEYNQDKSKVQSIKVPDSLQHEAQPLIGSEARSVAESRARLSRMANAPKAVQRSAEWLADRSERTAKGELKEYGSGGLSSEELYHRAMVKGWEIYDTIKTKAEWLSAVTKELGDDVKPYLDGVWNKLSGEGDKGEALDKLFNLPSGYRERSLPTTLEENQIEGGIDRVYKVITNPESIAKAEAIITEKGIDGVIEFVKNSDVSAEQVATGMYVLETLTGAGETSKAIDLATDLSAKLTKYGQAVQAVRTIEVLSPARQLIVAQKLLDKIRPGSKLSIEQSQAIIDNAAKVQSHVKNLKDLESALTTSMTPEARQLIIDHMSDVRGVIKEHRFELSKEFEKIDKWGTIAKHIRRANVFRAIQASIDLSAPGRQGMVFTLSHPLISMKAFYKQIQALGKNPEKYKEFENKYLYNDALFDVIKDKMGVEFTTTTGKDMFKELTKAEEDFRNDLFAEWAALEREGVDTSTTVAIKTLKKTIATPIVRSEQAFSTYLNFQRLEVAKVYIKAMESAVSPMTPKSHPLDYKYLGDFINKATGRGNLGKGALGSAAPLLGSTLFSPRYIASRFQLMVEPIKLSLPKSLNPISGRTRMLIAGDLLKFTSAVAATLFLADQARRHLGWDIHTTLNPEDPDFLKLRIGDSHYDISGGFQNQLRFMFQLGNFFDDVSSFIKYKGKYYERGDAQPRSMGGAIAESYGRRKLAPIPGFFVGMLTNTSMDRDERGFLKEFNYLSELGKMFTPISIQQLWEAYNRQGAKGIVKNIPEILGFGTLVYKPRR